MNITQDLELTIILLNNKYIIVDLNGDETIYSVFAFLYNLMRKEQCIDDIMQLCVDVLIIELYAKRKRKTSLGDRMHRFYC